MNIYIYIKDIHSVRQKNRKANKVRVYVGKDKKERYTNAKSTHV